MFTFKEVSMLNPMIYTYEPFKGDELLKVYCGFANKTLGHLCDPCDHCSLFCQDLVVGGMMEIGGGWCWHGRRINDSLPVIENESGLCIQGCVRCVRVVCEFRFIMRMIEEEFELPSEIVWYIASFVEFPCDLNYI